MYNNARPKVVDVVYRKTSGHHSNPGSSFNTTSSPPPWRIIPEQAGGGLLLDVGCHALDILEYMVGAPLENVRGDACARGTELVRVRCSRIVPRCYNKKYSATTNLIRLWNSEGSPKNKIKKNQRTNGNDRMGTSKWCCLIITYVIIIINFSSV